MSACHVASAGAVLALALLPAPASADTLHVPGNHPTIQAAIDAAEPGDVVLVAPGTYVERIDFLGKEITVEGSGGAGVTTLDGGGEGSVVTFQSGETLASVLRGVTVTGGAGSAFETITFQGVVVVDVGGGIKVVDSKARLEACRIAGNSAPAAGGGVFAHTSSIQVVDCEIVGNSTLGGEAFFSQVPTGGGGIYARGGSLFEDCLIKDNTGHGLCVNVDGSSTLVRSTIEGSTKAGIVYRSAFPSLGTLRLTDCIVRGNSDGGVRASVDGEGFLTSAIFIDRCVIDGNTGGVLAAGLYVGTAAGHVFVNDSMITRNTSTSGGAGGLWIGGFWWSVTSCTIAGNVSSGVGGAEAYGGSVNVFRNTIVWGNEGAQLVTNVTPAWCDVQGGFAGTEILDVDPHFVDAANGDFHLAPTSACQDAGDPSITSGLDLDGDPRVLGGRVDIGADEATFDKGPWTFVGHALAGGAGAPALQGDGPLLPDTDATLTLAAAAPSAPAWLVLGGAAALAPFHGGVMVPQPDVLVGPLATDAGGALAAHGRWPFGVPSGVALWLQAWVQDAGAPFGLAASNGLAATAP
jgi:hypothetical protein